MTQNTTLLDGYIELLAANGPIGPILEQIAKIRAVPGREDINAKDEYGYTLLMRAARAGYLGALQFLIREGADVNACNTHTSVLMEAAKGGHKNSIECVIELVQRNRKTDLTWRNSSGHAAEDMALGEEVRKIIRNAIADKAAHPPSRKPRRTRLPAAAMAGNNGHGGGRG